MIAYIFCMILLAAVGAAMMFRPLFFWKISHVLSVRGGEPIDLYLWFVRISGGIFVVLAIATVLILLLY